MLWAISPHLEELNKMIGMESLKQSLFLQIIYYLQGLNTKNKNQEYLHTVIYGNPGCGKSVSAEIIGNIYRSMGILSKKTVFKKVKSSDLIAQYIGHTAPKTRKMLESCIGGVMLIDEAYTLGGKSVSSFNKECIDTINQFLSEHRDDFCCIIAGYEDQIRKSFFSVNDGLESRFPWSHRIEDHTPENLTDIFLQKIEEAKWTINMNKKELIAFITTNKEHFSSFGRSIEVFFSKAKMSHAKRILGLDTFHRFILTLSDLKEAIKMMEENKVLKEKDNKPPDWMYI